MKKSPDSSIANCFYTTILILQQHVETKSTKIYPLFTVPLCHAMFVGERFCNYSWLTATEKRKKKEKNRLSNEGSRANCISAATHCTLTSQGKQRRPPTRKHAPGQTFN